MIRIVGSSAGADVPGSFEESGSGVFLPPSVFDILRKPKFSRLAEGLLNLHYTQILLISCSHSPARTSHSRAFPIHLANSPDEPSSSQGTRRVGGSSPDRVVHAEAFSFGRSAAGGPRSRLLAPRSSQNVRARGALGDGKMRSTHHYKTPSTCPLAPLCRRQR